MKCPIAVQRNKQSFDSQVFATIPRGLHTAHARFAGESSQQETLAIDFILISVPCGPFSDQLKVDFANPQASPVGKRDSGKRREEQELEAGTSASEGAPHEPPPTPTDHVHCLALAVR